MLEQGWTTLESAEATGWHRTRFSNYLQNGPPRATRPTEATVMTERWQARVATMLEKWRHDHGQPNLPHPVSKPPGKFILSPSSPGSSNIIKQRPTQS